MTEPAVAIILVLVPACPSCGQPFVAFAPEAEVVEKGWSIQQVDADLRAVLASRRLTCTSCARGAAN
jgi:hypothetical protein